MPPYNPPPEVTAFESDLNELGLVCDGEHWYVTEAWAEKFRQHFDKILPLAQAGDVAAQYALANIYNFGVLYASEEAYLATGLDDMKKMVHWLKLVAATGHVGALDNLLCVPKGISEEVDRLKALYRSHPEIFREAPAPSTAWEEEMRKLYELAYKQGE